MNKQIKKSLATISIIVVALVIIGIVYCTSAKEDIVAMFINLRYWYLLVVGIAVLYITPFLSNSVNLSPRSKLEKLRLKEKRIKRRKWSFSILLFCIVLFLNFDNPKIESALGKNSLGLSEHVGTIIFLLFTALIIYLTIISDRDYKFTFKDASLESNDDLEVIDFFEDSFIELEEKMNAQYNTWKVLNKYANETWQEISKDKDFDYKKAIEGVMREYIKDDAEIDDLRIIKSSELINYRYSDHKTLEEKLNKGQACTPRGEDKHFLIPFESIFGDRLIILMKCKHQPINLEQYIVLGILYIFEQFLANQYKLEDKKKT